MEVNGSSKNASLFRYNNNYDHKIIYSTGPLVYDNAMESMVRNENFEWIGPFTKLSDEMFSTSKLKLSAPRSLVRNLKIYIFNWI